MANSADTDQLASSDQLIWIFTVCKGRAYPGSAGLGLILSLFVGKSKCCGYSLEVLRCSSYYHYSQHMFCVQTRKIIYLNALLYGGSILVTERLMLLTSITCSNCTGGGIQLMLHRPEPFIIAPTSSSRYDGSGSSWSYLWFSCVLEAELH